MQGQCDTWSVGLSGRDRDCFLASAEPLLALLKRYNSLKTRLTPLGGVPTDPVPQALPSPLCRDRRTTEPLPTTHSASPRLPPQQAHVLPAAPA